MTNDDLRKILRDNVLTLLLEEAGADTRNTGVGALIRRGLSNGTAQRVLGAKTSVGLDVLADLGRTFGVAPWRLIRRNEQSASAFAARSDDDVAAAIGRRIAALPETQRRAIEALIESLGTASRPKIKSGPRR
jgi:hypothetical protein